MQYLSLALKRDLMLKNWSYIKLQDLYLDGLTCKEMVKQLKDNVVGSNTHAARCGAQMFWIPTDVYKLESTQLLLRSLVDSQVHSCNQSEMIRRRKPEPATIYNNDKNNVQMKARLHFTAKFKYSQV